MDEGLSSRVEDILKDILGDDIDLEKPRSRVEALLLALAEYISEMGGGYQGFSPWPHDPRHCARVVMKSTSEWSFECSVRRSITDTEVYYPLTDYLDPPRDKLPPHMRFLDSEFCTFNVTIDTDPESGDSTTVVSELNFTISNPDDTLITLANAARGFFAEPDPNDEVFQTFILQINWISGPTSSEHLENSPASFWVFV